MNTRSLKFQLVAWYAALLLAVFAVLGAATYLALRTSLVESVKENQLRRARQIAQLLYQEVPPDILQYDKTNSNQYGARVVGQSELLEFQQAMEHQVSGQIQATYVPEINDRFIRITRRDGGLVYLSPIPKSQSFEPSALPPPKWPKDAESAREVPLMGNRRMMVTAHVLEIPNGKGYLIETGAPMDEVQADLRHWLGFMLATLPVVAAIALLGGYGLVKRALVPVDRIASALGRISSQSLTERLPVVPTGDELERLSVALNHMIERLEGAFQQSRRFVADASHELRTPLTVLKGELESLTQQSDLDERWRERLGSALEEVDRLTGIVEGLFAISRLDAGEAAAEWVKFDLAQLVTGTADQMALLAEDKNIKLTCAGKDQVWVQGDRARLKQVVVNLLDNAIKYTPEGGSVSLSVTAEDSKAVFDVTDTGTGIAPEILPRIFDRFFRADQSRSREQGGAGLGLSIVKAICTAHHGRVEASSTPGKGSRFHVELPLVSPAPGSQQRHKNHGNRKIELN